MKPLTQLEERLAGEGGEAVRSEIRQRLRATEARLEHFLATQLLTPEEFKRGSVLQHAYRAAAEFIDCIAQRGLSAASSHSTLEGGNAP